MHASSRNPSLSRGSGRVVATGLCALLVSGWVTSLDAQAGAIRATLAAETNIHDASCTFRRIGRQELVSAMRQHGDYDILATTNRGRFSTNLLLRLAAMARSRAGEPGWEGRPLYVDPDDWFFAFLETAGITAADAPESTRLGRDHRQRVLIDYRTGRVVRRVKKGPIPELAVNVRAWWPRHAHPEDRFSTTDTTSVPKIKATSRREISYRLLQLEDMVLMDKIEGLTGRPLDGVLGPLFSVIGEGGLKQSRFMITDDGLQLVRTRSKKVVSVSATITVQPDGTTTRDIPKDRPDLEAVKELLERDLDFEYADYDWVTEDGACAYRGDPPTVADLEPGSGP